MNWQEHDLAVLKDRHARVWIADYLARKYKYHVDWRSHSKLELESMREHIRYAQVLKEYFGNQVDWRKHSLAEMHEMKRKMIVAENQSRHQGTKVDWRTVELPPDPLRGHDPDFAKIVRSLANYAHTTTARVLTLAERASDLLKTDGKDVDTNSLVIAAWEIHRSVRTLDVQTGLASYGAYRIDGMGHGEAVDQVISDHQVRPIRAVVDVGSFRWSYALAKKRLSQGGQLNYVVIGTVENLSKSEFHSPELGEMITFVDQMSREYSPVMKINKSNTTLRPSIPFPFVYTYEVAQDSVLKGFKIRELDDEKNQLDNDAFEFVPWP